MNVSRRFVFTAAVSALALPLAAQIASPSAWATQFHKAPEHSTARSATLDAVRNALRDLWIGHVFWTRNVVTAELAHNPGARQIAEAQVLANARAIADAMTPYYGPGAAQKLFGLLGGHYGAIKSYLDASIAKSPKKQASATAELTANGADIAVFLSGANPNLPRDTVENLLQVHGSHHIAQIQQLQAGNYAEEAQTWTDMTQHMYVIADAIAGALAKQFPEKFRGDA
ncbi:MAG: hypothetical protein AB7O49_06470 [Sphingomonadales bacterium]